MEKLSMRWGGSRVVKKLEWIEMAQLAVSSSFGTTSVQGRKSLCLCRTLVLSSKRLQHSVSSCWERRACCAYLNQVRRLSPLPQGKTTTPNYPLKHARSGSDN